jgi:hypothetical protein
MYLSINKGSVQFKTVFQFFILSPSVCSDINYHIPYICKISGFGSSAVVVFVLQGYGNASMGDC